MLSARTLNKFKGLQTCSEHGHRAKDLYQMILNAPDLWEQAYVNIYTNKGGMTPGVEGPTLDGYSSERATNLRMLLRENRYVPTPVRRVYIPKANGKRRPLGMPTANDKQVQEVWRMVLEAIYEPVFKDTSHGFRPQRSCHTALEAIRYWQGTKWFIEFDIEGFFDNIDHNKLVECLEKKIDDTKFINVIRKMLKAGYVEEWKYHHSYSGTPQGGIISPILANIYLHELDSFAATLCATYAQGKVRSKNVEWQALSNAASRLNKKIEQASDRETRNALLEKKKELQRQGLKISSKDQYDPGYRRLRYCRYADDFVLGAICSREEAELIYRKIETFLQDELKLTISHAKSGIKHNTETIRFLGYDITINNTERIVKTTVRGQHTKKRSLKGHITFLVPEDKLQSFAKERQYGNWTTLEGKHRPFLLNIADAEIALLYSVEMSGIARYYALANDFNAKLGKLRILWIRSFLKTMAAKHKRLVQQVATMLSRDTYMAVQAVLKSGKTKEIRLFQLKEVQRRGIHDHKVDHPPQTQRYTGRSELLKRMEANTCEYCGKEGGYTEVHHIRKLADIKAGKQPWEKLMIARHRKTLVLCIECHRRLTNGMLPDYRTHQLK